MSRVGNEIKENLILILIRKKDQISNSEADISLN